MKKETLASIIFIIFLASCVPVDNPEPISPSLKDELCQKLDDVHIEPLCFDENPVQARDIFPLLEKKFIAYQTTYDEVENLLGPERLEELTPFYFNPHLESRLLQFDLSGTGINRIVMYADPNYGSDKSKSIESVVFIRPDIQTPLSETTVMDLCKRFDLDTSEKLCLSDKGAYAQDFFPIIQERFMGQPLSDELLSLLKPYTYNEETEFYKYFFFFAEQEYPRKVFPRAIFYFDKNKILENFEFVESNSRTPLDKEIKIDLCNQLKIDLSAKKCKPGTVIFSTGFHEEIMDAFPIGIATYEDVQEILGKYQIWVDYPMLEANGDSVASSWYSFVGNNYYKIRFDFDVNFILTDISFTSGGDS